MFTTDDPFRAITARVRAELYWMRRHSDPCVPSTHGRPADGRSEPRQTVRDAQPDGGHSGHTPPLDTARPHTDQQPIPRHTRKPPRPALCYQRSGQRSVIIRKSCRSPISAAQRYTSRRCFMTVTSTTSPETRYTTR